MWAAKLATTEVASALLAILRAERKGEAARFTAASTLARLAHQTRDKMGMLSHILAHDGAALVISGAFNIHQLVSQPCGRCPLYLLKACVAYMARTIRCARAQLLHTPSDLAEAAIGPGDS